MTCKAESATLSSCTMMSMPSDAPQAVRELVEGYVSKVERLVTNALDARRLASAGAAAGSFLGGHDGGRGPRPGDVGSTAKLAEILWQSLTEVRRLSSRREGLHSYLRCICICGCRGAAPGILVFFCAPSRRLTGFLKGYLHGNGRCAKAPCK